MIYPKNKSSASQSKQRSKKSFLNPYQREELKKRLIEKFTKLYGLNNPSVIKEEVTSFFKTNNEINADNLRILEQNVRVACLQKKSIAKTPAQLPNGQHVSNAHGSNGAGPSIVTHKNRAPSSNGSNRHKLPPVNSEMLDSRNLGVENLTEEDQWNAINKYNTYLFKQEQKLQRMKELEKRRKMQEQLDSQMKEKERRKNLEKAAKQDYVNAENELYNYECQQDVRRKELQKEKVIFEKEMRDLQMREIEERKRFEYEQEKTLDTYILNKTKAEIEEEHAEQIRKRQEKMDIMRKMMEENNERKRILLEQKEKEKQEDVELNKKAILLAEELEKQRELELKLRNDRIAKLIQNSEAKVKEIENKNYDMEMKNRRYQELREKAMKEKEARDNYMAQRRKEQLKTFLDRQVLKNIKL